MIRIDCNFLTRLALRSKILFQHPSSVRASAFSHPAVVELYTFLTSRYLPTRFPSLFAVSSSQLQNLASGATYPVTPSPCPVSILRTLGELVDEDFMFLLPDTRGALTLQAYVACFASGFAMDEIFDKDLDGIHSKVPAYGEKIGPSMKRWFARVGAGTFWRRANVSYLPRSSKHSVFARGIAHAECIGDGQWTITLHGQLRNEHGQNQVYDTAESALPISSTKESLVNVSDVSARFLGLQRSISPW